MFNIFSSLFGGTSKGLDEIINAMRPEKRGAPHGFGRMHRLQVRAARVEPEVLRYTRQQDRAMDRRGAKALSAAKRDKARLAAKSGTGCAGFHRSNMEV